MPRAKGSRRANTTRNHSQPAVENVSTPNTAPQPDENVPASNTALNTAQQNGVDPPAVTWKKEPRLSVALLNLMEENDFYRWGNWRLPGDPIVGGNKVSIHRKMAVDLFVNFSPWNNYIGPGKAHGEKKLARSLGLRLNEMKKEYTEASKELNITGGGEKLAEQVQGDPEFATKWAKVIAQWPYFEQLKRLLGERPNVAKESINNSGEDLDVSGLLGKANDDEAENELENTLDNEVIEDGNDALSDIDDAQEEGNAEDDAEGEEVSDDDVTPNAAGDTTPNVALDAPNAAGDTTPNVALDAPNAAGDTTPNVALDALNAARDAPPNAARDAPPRRVRKSSPPTVTVQKPTPQKQAPGSMGRSGKKRQSPAFEGLNDFLEEFEVAKRYRFDEKQKTKRYTEK
ncbi:MAG: hypothetical protein LQ338_001969 [Usnochroma carphineum]|nr:MAG: hypothetical protein LQ338_001969 [Usnochroma carphineum]